MSLFAIHFIAIKTKIRFGVDLSFMCSNNFVQLLKFTFEGFTESDQINY